MENRVAPKPLDRKFADLSTKAEETAIAALGFLAEESERLERFLALSGLGPENLRQAASAPGFLLGVLEYMVTDERLLLAFAARQGAPPEEVERARMTLGGRPREG